MRLLIMVIRSWGHHLLLNTGDVLLKHPSVALLNDQLKLRLEFSIEVVLTIISIKGRDRKFQATYRVLRKVSCILSHLMTDDSLGNTIGRGCLGKKLGVASVLQHRIKDGGFVDRAAHGQKTDETSLSESSRQLIFFSLDRLTRDSGEYMRCFLCPELLRFAFPLLGTRQCRRGCCRRRCARRGCTHLRIMY